EAGIRDFHVTGVQTCALPILQLPAMNTTQFKFVKSRLPFKPRPMGTIYQPEIAAEVIEYASRYPRREYYVGWPTFQAIVGNKIRSEERRVGGGWTARRASAPA